MDLSDVVVQLVRLGLRGDAASVSRYAKRTLRELAAADASPMLREQLAAMLVSSNAMAGLRQTTPRRLDEAGSYTAEMDTNVELPVLAAGVVAQLVAVVAEREHEADLAKVGLSPTRTILLTGPSGVGKTMTARWLAAELALPLFRADLATMMSSYLGQSGQNLRTALDHARSTPSVLLLDEFDALAKRRDDPTDVGELKRIVNVLLVELESWPAGGVLVAATNHPGLLDPAIWRRFERVVDIGLPAYDERLRLLERLGQRHALRAPMSILHACAMASEGRSGADITTVVRRAAKQAVISKAQDPAEVLGSAFVDGLLERATRDVSARTLYCRVCHDLYGMSQRDIAKRLQVSHVTVGKALKSRSEPNGGESHGSR